MLRSTIVLLAASFILPAPATAQQGGWQSVGTGDCPGRDIASSTGPNPLPGRCTQSFSGFTAVCWGSGCTYKNVSPAQCTGGANPGRMYTCAPTDTQATTGNWRSAGTGDCPGRDVAGSTSPNPEPGRCTQSFSGLTAVCWGSGCTYKNVPTAQCTGGANPGRMYTCAPTETPVTTGNWRSAGTGDCPGRDVAGSTSPNPEPGRCTPQFAGLTAVCWGSGCTYKNIATAQCTGGSNPGRMYTCGAAAAPPPPPPTPTPAPPLSLGNWRGAGTGDCPGRDVAGSTGPNPDPGKCTAQFAGLTAVCWGSGCTYKNIATAQCTGGSNPGRLYTCGATAAPPSIGVRYRVENLVFNNPDMYQNPRNYHTFLVDFAACTVRGVNAVSERGQETVRVLVCRDKQRLTFTVSSPGATLVEYDWVLLDGGRTIAGAYRQGSLFGPSVGRIN